MSRDALAAFLYQPTLKDTVAGLLIDRIVVFDSVGTSSPVITPSVDLYTVPTDRALLVEGGGFVATPGAAQTFVRGAFNLIRPTGIAGARCEKYPEFAPAAAAAFGFTWLDIGWLAMPGDRLQMAAQFSAAANPNTIIGSLWGLLIPRANVQAG